MECLNASLGLMFLYIFSYFQSGQFNEDMIPTVGFNMRKITKGNVTIKVCDVIVKCEYIGCL